MDRGYVDFGRLYALTQSFASFVIRAESNLDYSRCSYPRVDKSIGLRSDRTIALTEPVPQNEESGHCNQCQGPIEMSSSLAD